MSNTDPRMRFPKTDVRHWREKVFTRSNADYHVQIGFGGRQERWPLKTANRDQAAAKARDIYLSLMAHGYEPTRDRFKPWTVKQEAPQEVLTVGRFLEAAQAVATVRANTFTHYARKFRFLVASMLALKAGKDRFDPVNGFRRYRAKVDAVALADITPDKVAAWRVKYITAAGNPVQQNAARATAASIIRNAKALFSKSVLRSLPFPLPSPLPLDGVTPGKTPRTRYRSKVNASLLAQQAFSELRRSEPEQFDVFLLAFGAGLRRGEIDKLLWRQFDFSTGNITIEPNEYGDTKTEGSADTIDLSPEVTEHFRQRFAKAKTEFVIPSPVDPSNHSPHWNHYRCASHFKALVQWLRDKGVQTRAPLHTLRKEYGSLINQRFGIFAASAALRHSNISITREHYVDAKERIALDVGELLNGKEAVA